MSDKKKITLDVYGKEIESIYTEFKRLLTDIDYQSKENFDKEFAEVFDPTILYYVLNKFGDDIRSSEDPVPLLFEKLKFSNELYKDLQQNFPGIFGYKWISELSDGLDKNHREEFFKTLIYCGINPKHDTELGKLLKTLQLYKQFYETIPNQLSTEKEELLLAKDQMYNSFLGIHKLLEQQPKEMGLLMEEALNNNADKFFMETASILKDKFDLLGLELQQKIDTFDNMITPMIEQKAEDFTDIINKKVKSYTIGFASLFVGISFVAGIFFGFLAAYRPDLKFLLSATWFLSGTLSGIGFAYSSFHFLKKYKWKLPLGVKPGSK